MRVEGEATERAGDMSSSEPKDVKAAGKKTRGQIPQSVRFSVFRRDNFTCRYCGKSSPEVVLHCDHAISVKNGGSDDESNLVTACIDCNLGKSAKSVVRKIDMAPESQEGLVGLWGHTFDQDGEIKWQFKIVRKADQFHVCQLFSWLDGGPTECKLIETPILAQECKLYNSTDLMQEAYEKHCRKQRGKWLGPKLVTGEFG